MRVMVVLGARPQFIKTSIVCSLLRKNPDIRLDLIHTGQHYDYMMSKVFFDELEIPKPSKNLNIGSGTHAEQTGRMMIALESTMTELEPELVLVPGDTNSTLAGALTAAKLKIPVAHIEAGCRSEDMRMPEEINRILTDHCSTLLFTPSKLTYSNLISEGLSQQRIYHVGDTMYDIFEVCSRKAGNTTILEELEVEEESYIIVTVHRPLNVDDPAALARIIRALTSLAGRTRLSILFPAHPRTLKNLKEFHLEGETNRDKIKLIDPVSYLEMIQLIKNARLILTDSGGIQKEAFWAHVPCLTLRDNTEWIETIENKANWLVGNSDQLIGETAIRVLEDQKIQERLLETQNPYGEGDSSERIVSILKKTFDEGGIKVPRSQI